MCSIIWGVLGLAFSFFVAQFHRLKRARNHVGKDNLIVRPIKEAAKDSDKLAISGSIALWAALVFWNSWRGTRSGTSPDRSSGLY
jgi:uncharacterized membrane protein